MTIVYTQNFDGVVPPALPVNWGTVSGTWKTTTTGALSSPNALANNPAVDGNIIICTAASAIADMDVRVDVTIENNTAPDIILRSDAAGQNHYLWAIQFGSAYNNPILFKSVSGSYAQLQVFTGQGYSGSVTNGTQLSIRARVQGSNLYYKIWQYGTSEPSSWSCTYSDSSITAAGYFGFRNQNPGSQGCSFDNVTLDNLVLLAISPTSVNNSSTGNTLSLTGDATAWTGGMPGSPTFTVSGGTITAQTVLSAATATLTYSAPPSGGTVTITDPSTGNTALLTINSVASDFTLTPSSQSTAAGIATGNYTVAPNGTPSSSTTVSLSDGGAGGAFTPAHLTFTTSTAQTFTYTPSNSASLGTITLTATASGGFSASHTTICVVTAGPQTIPVTNADIFWSPANWDHLTSGTFGVSTDTMQATAPGAYLKFGVTGTVNLKLNIDNSTTSGFPAGNMPIVSYILDGGDRVDTQLSPSQTGFTISSSLSTGAHTVEIDLRHTDLFQGDRWGSSGVSPTNVLRINGIVIDGGASMVAPTLRSKRMVIYGDSRTECYDLAGTNTDYAVNGYGAIMARALNAEWGNLGYGSQGIIATGAGNVPSMMNSYNLLSAGRNRLGSNVDYVTILQGFNDNSNGVSGATIQADVQTLVGNLRTLYGSSTWILWFYDPAGFYASNFSAAVAAYKAANPSDTKVAYVDISTLAPAAALMNGSMSGGNDYTSDGTHFNQFGSGVLGALYAEAVNAAVATTAGYSRARIANAS